MITLSALPNSPLAAYSQKIKANGGTEPYTFGVTNGALPTGLSLASDGTLSGTPTAFADPAFTFTVTATDSLSATGTRTYRLLIFDVPEARITRAFFAMLEADALFAASFDPIVLVENPSQEAFVNYAQGSAAVQPGKVKGVDKPSRRQVSLISILVSLYVKREESEEDSDLVGLYWMSYIRCLAWGLAIPNPLDPSAYLNFATTSVEQLTPVLTKEGTRVLSYQVTFETDLDPSTGSFLA